MRLPAKDPAETKLLRFELAGELERGATLANAVLSVSVVAGADAGAAAVLSGAALLDNAELQVLQRVSAGLADCDYELRCTATDSLGLVHLVVATLPVRNLH